MVALQVTGMGSNQKCIRLPDRGRLLCAADLRGNLRDFYTVVSRFQADPEARLLFLGNLIHGPYLHPSEWKPELGSYYRDESPAILLKLSLLCEKYPGRVFALLGNHEYSHLGGPHTNRFADDETAALEARLGPEASLYLKKWMSTWPLWATSSAGILFSHAAPGAKLESLAELETLDYPPDGPVSGDGSTPQGELARRLGPFLWSAPHRPERAREVATVAGARFLVYGHEPVSGHETIAREQFILGTSFGLRDEEKRYLCLDLGVSYSSALDLREGTEVVPLYPPAPPPADPDDAASAETMAPVEEF
jgi:hypothetical protein